MASPPRPALRSASALALAATVPLAAACAPDPELIARMDRLEQSIAEVARQNESQDREMKLAWAMLFCGERVNQLFEDVDKECGTTASAPAAPPDAGTASPMTASACTTKSIAPAVMDADATHRGMFLSVMANAPSEVFPIGPGGAKDFSSFRVRRLEKLVQARLSTTRYLVVARISPKDAQPELAATQRATIIADQLKAMQIPDTLIRRWTYNFPMTRPESARYSSQLRTGEPADPNYAVWVFRVNC